MQGNQHDASSRCSQSLLLRCRERRRRVTTGRALRLALGRLGDDAGERLGEVEPGDSVATGRRELAPRLAQDVDELAPRILAVLRRKRRELLLQEDEHGGVLEQLQVVSVHVDATGRCLLQLLSASRSLALNRLSHPYSAARR